MDIKAQAEWQRQLESLAKSERARLLDAIAPIEMAGKNATLLAAPLFLTSKTYEGFAASAQALVDATIAIEQSALFAKGNVLFDRLYHSLSSEGRLLIDRTVQPRSASITRRFRRLDGYLAVDGHPAFIEINQSAPLAISFYERSRQYVRSIAELASATTGKASDLYSSLAKWFITELDNIGVQSKQATIAVSLETGYPAKFIDLPVACEGIRQAAAAQGKDILFVLAEPTEFSLSPEGQPLARGQKFDLLWRNTVYLKNYEQSLEEYEQIRYGATPMVNDLRSWLLRSKEFFAMIWDDELRVTIEALGIDVDKLRRITPLSYSIGAAANIPNLHKDQWILKRCDDGFGKGIVFGANLSVEKWHDFLHGSHGQDWIAQKLVEPMAAILPVIHADGTMTHQLYQCDLDPYVVNGTVSGILVRALPVDAHYKKMNIVEGAAIGHVSVV